MSRAQADLLLLLVALIWGLAFVAQKDSFSHVGACTFVAARFFLSTVLVLPFAIKEYRRIAPERQTSGNIAEISLLCAAFCVGVIFQQIGIGKTSVTNAGFLTGLYVVFVPVICTLVYRQKLSAWIFPAALLSIAGTWLLSGGGAGGFSYGDILVFICAIGFAVQVVLIGRVMARIRAPFSLSCLQYAVVTIVAIAGMAAFEHPTMENIYAAAWPILYAGVISGGIAYTLQVVAQQYAPASDSAIILSGEAVFAAIAGAMLIGERLTMMKYFGCGLIALAILLVEFAPLFFKSGKNTAN